MRLNKILFQILLSSCSLCSFTYGQYFNWKAGVDGFFDNREYDNEYGKSQTLFGTQFFGTAEFEVNSYLKFETGVNVIFEFGSKVQSNDIKPIIFLGYRNNLLTLNFGSFPIKNLIDLPLLLHSDTIQYFRPNCEGIYLELKKHWGKQSIWIDWISRQSEIDHEIFQIGGTGTIKKGVIFYRHDFIMTHFANPGNRTPDNHVRDNGGILAGVGVDLSNYLFDSLTFSLGYCFSYDRLREVSDFIFSHGILSQFYIERYNIGLKSTIYLGDGQELLTGDRLYRASYYNRFDIEWHIFNKKYLSGSVEFSLHNVKHVLDVSQSFKLTAIIGGKRQLKSVSSP